MAAVESVSMGQAAAILGVSHAKMWRLVKDGILPVRPNPLDRREKLVRVADLEGLKGSGVRPWPSSIGMLKDFPVRSDEVEEYLAAHWRPD